MPPLSLFLSKNSNAHERITKCIPVSVLWVQSNIYINAYVHTFTGIWSPTCRGKQWKKNILSKKVSNRNSILNLKNAGIFGACYSGKYEPGKAKESVNAQMKALIRWYNRRTQ